MLFRDGGQGRETCHTRIDEQHVDAGLLLLDLDKERVELCQFAYIGLDTVGLGSKNLDGLLEFACRRVVT